MRNREKQNRGKAKTKGGEGKKKKMVMEKKGRNEEVDGSQNREEDTFFGLKVMG